MIINFGENLLDVDYEKTENFYSTTERITQGCNCAGCLNYEKATELFPEEVTTVFEKLGVDRKKAAEIIPYVSKNHKKDVLYGGIYHMCGKMLSEDTLWQEENLNDGKTIRHLNENKMYQLSENFKIGFCNSCELLEKGFPLPVIQIEILFVCPWVLSIENPY